jgi:hypothetical protein
MHVRGLNVLIALHPGKRLSDIREISLKTLSERRARRIIRTCHGLHKLHLFLGVVGLGGHDIPAPLQILKLTVGIR